MSSLIDIGTFGYPPEPNSKCGRGDDGAASLLSWPSLEFTMFNRFLTYNPTERFISAAKFSLTTLYFGADKPNILARLSCL